MQPFTLPAKVKRLRDVPLPEYHSAKSAGFDLAIPEAITVHRYSIVPAMLGLVIKAPRSHMLLVVPRSSTCKRWGVELANTVGIVDEDYCGDEDELGLLLRNIDQESVTIIPAGTRLAQGIFVPVTRGEFEEVEGSMSATRGGWGSTGV